MGINILGKGKMNLSHNIKFIGLSKATIISCQVRSLSLFAKVLDEKEVAVFGDYDIFICYRNGAKEGEHNYETKFKREVFCEVIPYEKIIENEQIDSQEIKAAAIFTNGPNCDYKLITFNHSNSYLEIKVSGEIRITVSVNEIESNDGERLIIKKKSVTVLNNNDEPEVEEPKSNIKNDKEKAPKKNEEKMYRENDENSDLKVLQFEDGIYSIEELMEMDFETLESIKDK